MTPIIKNKIDITFINKFFLVDSSVDFEKLIFELKITFEFNIDFVNKNIAPQINVKPIYIRLNTGVYIELSSILGLFKRYFSKLNDTILNGTIKNNRSFTIAKVFLFFLNKK